MKDYAGLLIGTSLFALLTPGLVFQLPAKHRPVEFLNMTTSIPSILLHTVIYTLLLVLLFIVLDVHLYV